MSDVSTDQELLAQIRQGNKIAFTLLVDKYLQDILNFTLRYLNQRADAEDIAQETFTRLWCKAPVWQNRGYTVKTWLFRVAYNLCIDELRKQKPVAFVEAESSVIDESAFTDRQLANQNNLSIQSAALNEIPERQRTAIALCVYQGLSNKEAALVLGVSIDALESLLARGRRKLKQLFKQATEQPEDVSHETSNDIN
jgi:RNA polymerase sigma-70 factor (ECF subfamily)